MFPNYIPILCQSKNSLRLPIAVSHFLPPIVYFRNSARGGWLDVLAREMVFTTWKNQVKKWELRIPCLYHLSASSNKDKIWLYRRCLGHPSFSVLKIMFPSLCKGSVSLQLLNLLSTSIPLFRLVIQELSFLSLLFIPIFQDHLQTLISLRLSDLCLLLMIPLMHHGYILWKIDQTIAQGF